MTNATKPSLADELRHALEGLVEAASDLDAAVEGATDQFDDERASLDAAIRVARKALAKDAPPAPIVIEVRGGNVQDVLNVPAGYECQVIDYDNLESEGEKA